MTKTLSWMESTALPVAPSSSKRSLEVELPREKSGRYDLLIRIGVVGGAVALVVGLGSVLRWVADEHLSYDLSRATDEWSGLITIIAYYAGGAYLVWFATVGRIGAANQKIEQQWANVIADAADYSDKLFDQVKELILSREAPGLREGDLKIQELRDQVLLSEKRRFLLVRQRGPIKLWRIYLGVRPYGKELQISWYLILKAGFLRRVLSRIATFPRNEPFELWEKLSVFGHQDLHARASVVHGCVKQGMAGLMAELGQDFGKVDTKSSGVLELW